MPAMRAEGARRNNALPPNYVDRQQRLKTNPRQEKRQSAKMMMSHLL